MITPADPRAIKLLVAGPDLKPIAPLTTWKTIEATVTLNQAGAGSLTIPADQTIYDLVSTPGNRIHLYYQGRIFLAGMIESYPTSEQAGIPQLMTVTWTSDMFWLAARLTYPQPSLAATAQTNANYTATGTAETVLRDLVNLNAGPGARTERQVPHLVLGAANSPLVGSSVTVTAPMSQTLTDTLREVASSGGSLAFDVVLNDAVPQLEFVVWAPRDVSNLVWYSKGLNNLQQLDVNPVAPTATVAIVGTEATTNDDGASVPGTNWERTDSAAASTWGRIEVWVASTADTTKPAGDQTTQSNQDGDLALLSAAQQVTITSTAVDTPGREFGVNYRLNDIVGARPVVGIPASDSVSSVKLTADSQTGVVVAPTFGGNPRQGVSLQQQMRIIQRQMARLQAGRR